MPSPLNISSIPAPRTPLTDPATGLLSREWYRFFLNLFNLTGAGSSPTSLTDLQVGPPFATVDEINNSTDVKIQGFATSPSQDGLLAQIAELQKQVQEAELSAEGAVMALQAQLTNLATDVQGLALVPPALGFVGVTGTAPVVSSGGNTPAISLAANYGDTQNPYASKTANFILGAPNGVAGLPTFRAIVAADIPTLNQNTTGTASNVTGIVAIANGGTGSTTAPNALTALGAYPASNPSGFTSNTGTVTSVTGTAPIVSSGGATPAISLAASYGDTQNPYASKTANFVLAAPNGSAGVPTFRAVVAADIPTLNQNTTGTASNVTGTVAVVNGGTGQTTYTNGQLLIGNTTGNTLTKTTLTAGTGISVTNAAGAITITNTGAIPFSGAGATITTALTSTGLTAALGIGTFEFRAIIFGQSSSAAGGTFQTAYTGTTTSIDMVFQGQATGTTFVATNRVIAQATNGTTVWTTATTEMTMMISGVIVTSTAGTFTINATKTTSGTLTIRSGSNLIIG